jgi:hypothetical protein
MSRSLMPLTHVFTCAVAEKIGTKATIASTLTATGPV